MVEGAVDRDGAAALVGRNIAVPRGRLPVLAEGDFYWSDLIGLRVRSLEGDDFGVVTRLFETGSNDVMVVQDGKERLIPFLHGRVVKQVDLEAGTLQVDWDADF